MHNGYTEQNPSPTGTVIRQINTTPLKSLLLVGTCGLAILLMLWYSHTRVISIAEVHVPLIAASHEVRIELSVAHVWLEEILSGDSQEEIADVREHLDNANRYLQAMLTGGDIEYGRLSPLESMEVRNLVKQAQIQLSRFRIIAEQRYAAFEQSGPGTGIDQSFDLLFEELLSHCSLMEKGVEECLTDDLRYSHNLYLLLAVLTVVLTLLVGLFVYRYRQRELKDNHALQESQQRFHRLSENAQDVIYRMSLPDGRYEYISSAATEIFGYTPKEFIATPLLIRKITHPDWQEYFRKEHEKLLTGEMPPTYEYQILHGRTGETRWLNQRNVLIRDPEGNPVAIEGIVTDITDRRQALERLAENQARFQGVFESMSSGVAVYQAADEGADFVFVDFNPAAEKIENISRDQVIGRRLTEVFPGVVDFGLLAVFQRVWRTGEPEQFPVSFYEDKRITGWRENYIYRLPGGEVVAVYDDLTEKKMAEQELIQHRDHLEELVGERTAELRRTVKLMAGRETRMADLKQVIVQLRKQLAATGISPLVDDPLRDGGGE